MKSIFLSLVLLATSFGVLAEAPKKVVTIVNPFSVSGLTDLVARMAAEKSRDKFPNGTIIVSRPGAGGSIGIASVTNAPRDGSTIGFTPTGSVVDLPQMQELPYKNPDDLEPIINVMASYQLLAVSADSKWKTLKEYVDDARAAPGKLSMGHTGRGTASHLNMAQLVSAARLDLIEIPYTGWAQSSVALLGRHVDAIVINPGEGRQLIQQGRIRVLGVFQPQRVPFYPDVPTFKEAGYDVGVSLKFFFFGPKGMDPAVRQYMHDAFKAVMDDPEFKSFLQSREVVADYMDGPATKAMLWSEFRSHTALLESLGLKARP
ncbi:MAG: tripartite tricarboxylate transporter substrate binding protein [Burkholderiales bacterium]|nr:tripartite tricarboxylate transporter substrate binding protein [Burkholderiales bacterium]